MTHHHRSDHDRPDQQHAAGGHDEAGMAELLDLDAEVLHTYLSEVTAWIQEVAGDRPGRRILDVGAGTGTGTFALLECFEGSEAVAVDISPGMLERVAHKARRLELVDRVTTVEADLDAAWPALGPVDLVWASSSLHHMADPDRALREILAALRPGGLLAMTEMDSFPHFLPDDVGIGRPGLESRCHAAIDHERAGRLPDFGSDWGSRLARAGFTLEAERVFDVHLTHPLPDLASRYAQVSLRRARAGLTGVLDAEDLGTLETLAESDGPDGVLHRGDLTVRTMRTGWIARRP